MLRVTERARTVVHVPRGPLPLADGPGSAAGDAEAKPYAWARPPGGAGPLDRVGIEATAELGHGQGIYRLTAGLDPAGRSAS